MLKNYALIEKMKNLWSVIFITVAYAHLPNFEKQNLNVQQMNQSKLSWKWKKKINRM